jgi:hypothetical protein
LGRSVWRFTHEASAIPSWLARKSTTAKAHPAGLRPETSQGTAPCRAERQPQASDARHGSGRSARGPGRSGQQPLELQTGRPARWRSGRTGRPVQTGTHQPARSFCNRPTGPRLPPKSSPLLLRGLFHHAAREPAFRQQMDRFPSGTVAVAHASSSATGPGRSGPRSLPPWSPSSLSVSLVCCPSP